MQKAIGRVAVIADGAHVFGAEQKGKMAGSDADFTSFSFHAVKNLTTAEGGAITWKNLDGIDNEWIYKQYQLLSLHGQSKDALAKTEVGAWEYDIVSHAYKCIMTDILGAIGLVQLSRYKGMVERRHEIIGMYDEVLHKAGIQTLAHKTADSKSSGHLYLTRVPGITPEQRNEIIIKMAENNIACNVHYKPLPMMTGYKALGFKIEDYPNAYNQFKNEISLPLHTRLTDDEVKYVAETFVKCVNEVTGK